MRRLRTARYLAGAALLATIALAGPVASAQDAPPPPADLWETKSADIARVAAGKLWNAVAEARRAQLWAFAREQARKVVELDPEHREARALLGFAKRDGAWVADPALEKKTPTANFPEKDPGLEAVAAAERKWTRDALTPARTAAALAWTSFADECAKRTDVASAKKAWARALEFDPAQKRAHEGLGEFLFSGIWVTEPQYRKIQVALRGQIVEADSPVDQAFGGKLWKVDTPHFRVMGRIQPERLQEFARWLETAYAVHLAAIGRDPTDQVFASPVRMVVCATEQEWNVFVNTFVERNRDFYRTLEGCWAEGWMYGMRPPKDDSDETRRDHLVHRAVHAVDQFALGIFWPSWVDEGLSHLTTVRVQGMTRTWCVAPSKSEYAKLDQPGGKTGWVDEKEWRSLVRAAAAAREDLPLRTLVMQPFPELGLPGVLKAWSVLDWLSSTDAPGLRALLPKLRATKTPEKAWEEHFGKALEGIDEDWRRHVLRSY